MHGGYIAEVEHIDQPDLKEFIKRKNKLTFVCIDEVTDPRNIGSLIRSASSFHIDGLIVKERQFPSDSKLMYKAASGCMEHINIFEVSNINSTLKNYKRKEFLGLWVWCKRRKRLYRYQMGRKECSFIWIWRFRYERAYRKVHRFFC